MTTAMVEAAQRIAADFGKLGVLIDDNKDGPWRMARDLYYADTLPEFWLVLRSVECAEPVLAMLLSAERGSVLARCPCLVIVDRHLLQHCRSGGERSVRIDSKSSSCAAHLRLLHEMTTRSGATLPNLMLRLITTHPLGKTEDAEHLEWLPRSPWVMSEIREALRPLGPTAGPNRFEPLRRYGVNRDMASPSSAAQRWKRDSWDAMLSSLAAALRREEERETADREAIKTPSQSPVVLLTGAGVSLQAGPYGPGIPRTNALLFEAAWRLAFAEPLANRQGEPSLVDTGRACDCRNSQVPVAGSGRSPSLTEFMREVKEAYTAGRTLSSYPGLLSIFDSASSKQEDALARYEFYMSFRTVMQRFDHAFSYRHWLMAQLPWSCIVTTNFDNFHERAAMVAARHPEVFSGREQLNALSHAALRRGNPVPLFSSGGKARRPSRSQRHPDPLVTHWTSCRLFKPYGTLESPQPLVLNDYEMSESRRHFARVFELAFSQATSGWLVVIGHSMQDEALQKALSSALKQRPGLTQSLNVVWVGPDAHRITCDEEPIPAYANGCLTFPKLVRRRMRPAARQRAVSGVPEQLGEHGGAYAATAIEFLYDLALKFDERGNGQTSSR